MHSKFLGLLVAVLLVVVGSALAQTTPPPDVFMVNYFAGNTAENPDATVRITHPGTSSSYTLCALVYVFHPDQQMAECCGCALTPNGLRTLSVARDLTSNPLTGVALPTGVIKIASSLPAGGICDPRKITATAALRAWGTHIQAPPGFGAYVTESAFSDATLSTTEITRLQNLCKSIVANGSGHGICTCGSGD